MKHTVRHALMYVTLMSLAGLAASAPSFAADSGLPAKPQAQSEASQSVQPKVDKQTADAAADKRKKLFADATAALAETKKALKALENKKNDAALKALAEVVGKLDLILARDPKLELTAVDTEVVTYDLLANLDTIKAIIKEANAYLNDGEIQKARPLVANLASEIQYRTIHIPLATYPKAIKAIAPLIDAGKIDEAKAGLQAALNTLVVTTDDVVPLPKLRAEHLLKQAQELAEKKDRSKEENETLAKHLQAAREQLQMAELLGYGKKKDYNPMYEQISEIEKNRLVARVAPVGSTSSSSNFPIYSEAMRRVVGWLIIPPRARASPPLGSEIAKPSGARSSHPPWIVPRTTG